jgi:hypothetical protein
VPPAAEAIALEKQVLAASLAQMVAHREACLAGADDYGVMPLHELSARD